MNFSLEWEQQYQSDGHMSVWPWSDLISKTHAYASPKKGFQRVLELGCGAGANIPFFKALSVDYYAIDGSKTVVEMLKNKFPELATKICVGDFTKNIPFEEKFDLIVDRSSLISCTTEAMIDGLKLASSQMRTGSRFIAIDWFSIEHDGFEQGQIVDSHTRNNFPTSSDLHATGNVHFCDEEHLKFLMKSAGLEIIHLEHKISTISSEDPVQTRAWWNLVATKL